MSAHTPGPWQARVSNAERYSYIVDADGPWPYNHVALIPEMFGEKCLTPGAQSANARLIAAAPDLLAALKAMNKCLADGASAAQWTEANEAACAAIAAAEEQASG